jgi:hypothetical protein
VPRGLDHIVHAVHDLDAAAELYQRLGFQVSARNRHPWGTHNRIVQFDGAYIELLTVGEPEKIEPHRLRSFSFGAFHRDFLARDQGLDMILLKSRDAKADAVVYRAAGIGDYEVVNFERQGQRPDGTVIKLAFSLAFVANPNAPDIGFATCQHHFPENFWNPDFQRHANGAKRIAGAVMVAGEPSQHRDFLLAYTGVDKARDTGDGFVIDLPNATIDIMSPLDFRRRFGVSAPVPQGRVRLVALRFTRSDETAGNAGIMPAMGAVLVFELASPSWSR